MHALPADPARWPADLAVLIWAIRVCEASGAAHLADGFERLLGRLERPAPSAEPVVAAPPA